MEYKVGDKVRRIGNSFGQCKKDNVYTIVKVDTTGLYLKGLDSFGYEPDNFELVKEDYNNNYWTDEMLEPVEDIIEYKGKKYDVVHFMEETILTNAVLYLKEHKEEILDKEEKEYLRGVIRPFRNAIKGIEKRFYFKGKKYIRILYKNGEITDLLCFADETMYKGMEPNKEYTLEDLGL